MEKFIAAVTDSLYRAYGSEISRFTFVFPNQRTGLFFQKRLGELTEQPLLVPKITTINTLICSYGRRQLTDRIYLLFVLYEVYCQVKQANGQEAEPFDKFVFWGEIILNDFDDVDKWMVNARQLFENVRDLKLIEQDKDYLSEEQISIIRTFWNTFFAGLEQKRTEGNADAMENFLSTWQVLYPLYEAFRQRLDQEGVGYEGLIYREVIESIRSGEIVCDRESCIFVGLNAFTRSEELFLIHLKGLGLADFYWDYDFPDLLEMKENRAGYYAASNRSAFPSKHTVEFLFPTERPEVELYAIPSSVGQTKQVQLILNRLEEERRKEGLSLLDSERGLETAVILPDETLLQPLLYAIPEAYERVNVTMGYSLSLSLVAGLMEKLFEAQLSTLRYGRFYHATLLPLLNHPLLRQIDLEQTAALQNDIIAFNRLYVKSRPLEKESPLNDILTLIPDTASASTYLLDVLEQVRLTLSPPIDEMEDEESDPSRRQTLSRRIENEFLYQYRRTVERLARLIVRFDFQMEVSTYFRLLRSLVSSISIPFEGEPLAGLQIMGVLETRGLDFENIIITSMNEGKFPNKTSSNSFIPHNLRRGFGLSLVEHQEAVYAYHFYRLIARARRLFFIYDTRVDDNRSSSEVSRYVHQLEHLYGYSIRRFKPSFDVRISEQLPLAVAHNETIADRLACFEAGGGKAFSASSLKSLIDCPLRFYFSEIAEIREEEEVSEEVQDNLFGTIYHHVMERLYTGGVSPKPDRVAITHSTIEELMQQYGLILNYIHQGFARYYYKDKGVPEVLPANLRLIVGLIRRYVLRTLQNDKLRAPFYLVGTEERMRAVWKTPAGRLVNLKGAIDRIDLAGSTIRLIDYKSGQSKLSFRHLDELFTPGPRRPYQIFQVFFYGLLLEQDRRVLPRILQRPQDEPIPLSAYNPELHILSLRNLNQPDTAVVMAPDRKTIEEPSTTYRLVCEEYQQRVGQLIDSLFEQPVFEQTSDVELCKYCAYRAICKR